MWLLRVVLSIATVTMNDSASGSYALGYISGNSSSNEANGSVHFRDSGAELPPQPFSTEIMATKVMDYVTSGDLGSDTRYSFEERITIGVVLSVIIFFSIGGNVLVCIAVLTERNLRKTSNYFIISLAIADMLVAILVMTFAVANDIMGYWVFGGVFCNIWMSSDVMCSTASILNLCAVSLDRYINIRSPLHYERWVTKRRTVVVITSIWLLSGLISFLPIHLGWHELGSEYGDLDDANTTSGAKQSNTSDFDSTCILVLNPLYAVISSMVSFYIPCLVMILIYFKMYQYARMHVKSIKKSMAAGMVNQISNDGSTSSHAAEHHPTANKHQYKMSDHKAAITLGVIMGVFLMCWVPFFTINIIGAFCPECIPPVVFSIFTWLGYLNSTMNPVIYSIFNTEFREAFKRVLTFAKCRGVYHHRRAAYEYDKPIRSNGASTYTVEYGTVPSSRKLSEAKLMPDKITSV